MSSSLNDLLQDTLYRQSHPISMAELVSKRLNKATETYYHELKQASIMLMTNNTKKVLRRFKKNV